LNILRESSGTPQITAVEPPLARASAVIVAPYPMWLEALGRVVAAAGVRSVRLARAADEALALVEEVGADLLVVDSGVDMPAVLDFIREARERESDLRTIVVADRHELEFLERAFDAGVFACVLRTADADDLMATVRHAFSESIYFPRRPSVSPQLSILPAPGSPADGPRLTRREVEILSLAAAGQSNAEVARRLWVTEQTVKFHLSNVYRKLKVANRTQAAHWARNHSLFQTPVDDERELGDVG
jgi:DNA-binding NarL/FixJ family response regulator